MPASLVRITASQEVMLGKPVVRGTRLTVELLLRKISEGATATDLLQMYLQLKELGIQAVLKHSGLR